MLTTAQSRTLSYGTDYDENDTNYYNTAPLRTLNRAKDADDSDAKQQTLRNCMTRFMRLLVDCDEADVTEDDRRRSSIEILFLIAW